MTEDPKIAALETWMEKIRATPYKEETRNKLRLCIHELIIKKLKDGQPWEVVKDYVKKEEVGFSESNRNGPVWAHHEYEVIRQKIWSLTK